MSDNHTDRQTFDRSVREQYNRETAQVHAPAELIHRTKDAVRREEQRIAQEQAGQKMSEQQSGGSRAKAGRAYGRLHRWALGTAAAAVLLLVGASGLFFGRVGRSSEKSASDTAVQEIAADTTAAEETEAETAGEGGLGKQLGTAANTADYAVEEIAPAPAEEEKRKYEPRPQTAAAESAAAAISGSADETTDGMTDTTAAGDRAEADLGAVKESAVNSSADAVPALTGVQFYDKDKNAVEAEALWYNAARIESILIQWEGGTPADVKVFRMPAGSGTAEQTELLMTKSIPDGDMSVLLDADMLHDAGMGSHFFFELDFGTQIVKSEEYNVFYDESILPDAGD